MRIRGRAEPRYALFLSAAQNEENAMTQQELDNLL
jgi:hypothetical protein